MITSSGLLDNRCFMWMEIEETATDYTYWEQGHRDKIARDSGQTSL